MSMQHDQSQDETGTGNNSLTWSWVCWILFWKGKFGRSHLQGHDIDKEPQEEHWRVALTGRSSQCRIHKVHAVDSASMKKGSEFSAQKFPHLDTVQTRTPKSSKVERFYQKIAFQCHSRTQQRGCRKIGSLIENNVPKSHIACKVTGAARRKPFSYCDALRC